MSGKRLAKYQIFQIVHKDISGNEEKDLLKTISLPFTDREAAVQWIIKKGKPNSTYRILPIFDTH